MNDRCEGIVFMKRLFISMVFLLVANPAVLAQQLVWKTEKSLGEAKQLASCNPEKDKQCADFVPYVSSSKYGVKLYFTYREGTRVTYSFNGKDEDGFTVSTEQVHPGSYDWGGVIEKGKFKPLYMIKRFYAYDAATGNFTKDRTELMVTRLLKDGKFCGVETGAQVLTDNKAARRLAEINFTQPACAK
jgi:hypothetical protein